jgi:EAL domain-containing protein (putative c-di-GMP-specific phosphodiesterase class I)
MTHQRATDARAVADLNVDTLLRGLGIAPYEWTIDGDRIVWSGDPSGIAQCRAADLSTGAGWQSLIVPDSGVTRMRAVMSSTERDTGAGVPFCTVYAINRRSGSTLQVEDCGRWFAGTSGRPALVRGIVRRLGERAGDPPLSGVWPDPAMDALQAALDRATSHAGSSLMLLMDPGASRNQWSDATNQMLRRLRMVMRRGDSVVIAPDGLVAIALTGCADAGARQAAARLAAVASTDHPDWRIHVGAVRLKPSMGAAEALRRATAALMQSNAPGAEGFALHSERRARKPASSTQHDATRVLNALNGREILLGRRPAVSAIGRMMAWEVAVPMLRRGPRRFEPLRAALPHFEAEGIAALVEHRCLELALAHLRDTPTGRLRLPVSPAAIGCRSWQALLAAALADKPDLARRLLLDMDETVLAARVPATVKALGAMREQGVGLIVSGFGRGVLPFAQVAAAGCAAVALNEALIAGLKRSSDVRFILKAMVTSLRDLGVQTAADGVPDEEAAALAASLGVDVLGGEIAGEPRIAHVEKRPRARAAA